MDDKSGLYALCSLKKLIAIINPHKPKAKRFKNMPPNLLKESQEIEYKGINFISKLPQKDIKEIFNQLKKERRLIHEVNPYVLEVQEPFVMPYKDKHFGVIISCNYVMIDELGIEQ